MTATRATPSVRTGRRSVRTRSSIYDSKPVHVVSTFATEVKLLSKHRLVFLPSVGKKTQLSFFRLELIENYNFNMNSVDMAHRWSGSPGWVVLRWGPRGTRAGCARPLSEPPGPARGHFSMILLVK